MAALAAYLSANSISPMREMGAYEALWVKTSATFKRIADKFRSRPNAIPSDFVQPEIADRFAEETLELLKRAKIARFGIRVHGAGEYPQRLREADHPVELLYFQGWWDLVESRCVAVVGTRDPSADAVKRTRALVRDLVADKFTIVSGLARGVDTVAHETAIKAGGLTIAVIGTALSRAYPAENRDLQRRIAKDCLLISQVPVLRSSHQGPKQNRIFFPERNVTMSALTQATIIVEAGETSGTLVQANAALKQGRKLFILDSCFRRPSLTWPARLQSQGAIRVKDYGEIAQHLGDQTQQN
jgi:DNA processing protein